MGIATAIKYPVPLYRKAIAEKWEKAFALLFDLKAAYQNSFIKDYTDYDTVQPLLSKKISRETYFRYIRKLTRLKLITIQYNTLRMPSYRTFEGRFGYVKRCSQHLARMRAQIITRICDKQTAKISDSENCHEIKQLVVGESGITFEVVDLQKTIRLSCETLGKKFNRSKAWGFKLKRQLKTLGLLAIKNSKDLLGTAKLPEYSSDKRIRLFRGVYIRQHADQIKSNIKIDEREILVKLSKEDRVNYLYCLYDCM